jgi:hypothetical protein
MRVTFSNLCVTIQSIALLLYHCYVCFGKENKVSVKPTIEITLNLNYVIYTNVTNL